MPLAWAEGKIAIVLSVFASRVKAGSTIRGARCVLHQKVVSSTNAPPREGVALRVTDCGFWWVVGGDPYNSWFFSSIWIADEAGGEGCMAGMACMNVARAYIHRQSTGRTARISVSCQGRHPVPSAAVR